MTFMINDGIRHVKTGDIYYVIGTPDTFRIESTNEPAYVYQKTRLSAAWVRSQSEMEDGRFQLVDKEI
jgi:hypothetical protein